jgi:hypothetical protein
LTVSVAPALAGEDPGSGGGSPTPTPAPAPSATLHASQGCVSGGHRTKATVTGSNIASVKFYVAGKLIKTVTTPASNGRYVFSMSCTRLSFGAHTARAVVSFTGGTSRTLRFQITRSGRSSARFTG